MNPISLDPEYHFLDLWQRYSPFGGSLSVLVCLPLGKQMSKIKGSDSRQGAFARKIGAGRVWQVALLLNEFNS